MKKQIEVNQVMVHYTVTGSGKAVLFIHGFGEDGEVWKDQADFLKDYFTVIIPDLPGSGQSKVDNWKLVLGTNNLTVEWLSDCIKAVLDAEQITACSIIGHSMGGYVTLAFAEKYPSRLHKFGLFHSTAYADNEEKIKARRKGIEFIKEYGAYAFLKQSIPNFFGAKFSAEHPEEIEAMIEKGKIFSAESLIQYYEAMIARPDRTTVLKTFPAPVLFIIGMEDKPVSPQDSLEQSHMPAKSMVTIFENSGHMGMKEEKELSNKALFKFLSFEE
ncbi:MAG: alpha/beta hydrolase [Sphingobacteriales bacterium]|nr:alpha/beta hydrolase [Sphingobacteriales bacterium]